MRFFFFFFSSNIRSTKIAIRRLGVNFLAIFFFYFSYEIVLQYRAGENSKREGKFEDRIQGVEPCLTNFRTVAS